VLIRITKRVLNGANILITGGAGFIGASVAKVLAGANRVTLLDNLQRNALPRLFGATVKVPELIKCDVTDTAQLHDIVSKLRPTHIIHAAGVAGIDTVGRAPVRTIEVNTLGTANILAAANQVANIERIIVFSTSEIFGSQALKPNENSPSIIGAVGEPRWVYAVSKLAAEHLAFAHFKQNGLPAVILRPFNVYGPAQVGEGAMSMFIARAIVDRKIELYEDGSQIRSWCYIDDMVQGVMLALTKTEAVGQAFNIGNPRSTQTMFGLAHEIKRLTKSNSVIEYVRNSNADIALRVPDIGHPKKLLGFSPQVELEQGILLTADAYRELL
jgi:UDP-glucose 4-epimerase